MSGYDDREQEEKLHARIASLESAGRKAYEALAVARAESEALARLSAPMRLVCEPDIRAALSALRAVGLGEPSKEGE